MLHPTHKSLSREEFSKDVSRAFKIRKIELSSAQMKLLLATLGDRDEEAAICLDAKGRPEPDSELRDTENVPLSEDIQAYFEREVLPHAPDAWIDHDKTKVGYEIPFTRHFYKFIPPRSLEEIDADLKGVTAEILELLREVIHE
jgi:type I restriction enzyme M protein